MGGPGSGRKKGSGGKVKATKKSNIIEFPKSKKKLAEELYAKKKAAGKLTKSFVRYD